MYLYYNNQYLVLDKMENRQASSYPRPALKRPSKLLTSNSSKRSPSHEPSLDSLDSTLSDDNMGDFDITQLDPKVLPSKTPLSDVTSQVPLAAPLSPHSLPFAQSSRSTPSTKFAQPESSIKPLQTIVPQTSTQSVQHTPVNTIQPIPLSNIALPDPSSYPVIAQPPGFGNVPSPGYVMVSSANGSSQRQGIAPLSTPVYSNTEDESGEGPQADQKEEQTREKQNMRVENKTVIISENVKPFGILMYNCNVEIKEITNQTPSDSTMSVLDEVNSIYNDLETARLTPAQTQEIEKRLLQIVDALNKKD